MRTPRDRSDRRLFDSTAEEHHERRRSTYVISPPPQAAIAVTGSDKLFPVRRIWCVGRNYIEHIREMGQDERAPPFFFAKPADAIVPDGGVVPYPSLTKDMHHEVEMVVALKSGGIASSRKRPTTASGVTASAST